MNEEKRLGLLRVVRNQAALDGDSALAREMIGWSQDRLADWIQSRLKKDDEDG